MTNVSAVVEVLRRDPKQDYTYNDSALIAAVSQVKPSMNKQSVDFALFNAVKAGQAITWYDGDRCWFAATP